MAKKGNKTKNKQSILQPKPRVISGTASFIHSLQDAPV